jgi:acetyltransferase EpsM
VLNKEVILIGYSGHGFVVAETALDNGVNLIGYSEKSVSDNNPFNLVYLGFEKENDFIGWNKKVSFILGIGDNSLRQNITNLIESKERKVISIIHITASISRSAIIGCGTFISRNVAVNSLAVVGKSVILNTGCIIEHGCVIADLVHIAPGAVLAGNVSIGERSFIGANSVIKQGVKIGKDVIVGAGTVVLSDIPDGKKIVGNPSRFI